MLVVGAREYNRGEALIKFSNKKTHSLVENIEMAKVYPKLNRVETTLCLLQSTVCLCELFQRKLLRS